MQSPYSIKPLLLHLPTPIRLAWSKCSKNVLYMRQVQRTHEPSLRTSDNGSLVGVALVDTRPLALACSAILYISSFSPKSTNSNINVNYTNKANLSISLRKSRFISLPTSNSCFQLNHLSITVVTDLWKIDDKKEPFRLRGKINTHCYFSRDHSSVSPHTSYLYARHY